MQRYYQTERSFILLVQVIRDHDNGPFEARILDLNTGSEKNLPLTEDLFCIGLTHLANGNVLLAGGTKMYDTNPDNCNGKWHGLNVYTR